MAGTRTAPDVTGTATSLHLSVHFIDDSGDTWSESHTIPVAATPAQQEAYLDALQAASGASIYKVGREFMFGTDALADANNAEHNAQWLKSRSVFDSLNVTLKHTTDPEKKNKVVRIPAPIYQLFVNDFVDTDPLPPTFVSDSIKGDSAELVAVLAAAIAMFGATWSVAWARFSEKVELNEKVRI